MKALTLLLLATLASGAAAQTPTARDARFKDAVESIAISSTARSSSSSKVETMAAVVCDYLDGPAVERATR